MDTFDDRWDDVDLFNLIPSERQGEVVKPWDTFKVLHRKPASGSTVETKFIDNGTKFLKMATIVLVGVMVLATAVISKGLVLLMTSQVKKDLVRGYCHKEFDTSRTYTFTMPEIERSLFIWLLILAYLVPEAGTFTRSIRILIFKKREYPHPMEFFSLFTFETLSAIGTALLIFGVLPELDVVKGAMLTNSMSFVPGILLIVTNFNCRNKIFSIADLAALMGQATVIVWTLLDQLWLLPVAGVLVSCGWWENFVSEKSPIGFFRDIAKSRKHFPNSKYFSYSIISVSKSLVFFLTTLLVFYVREGQVTVVLQNFSNIFSSHVMFVNETSPVVGGSTIHDATSAAVAHEITSNLTLEICLWVACVACAYTSYAFSKFACKIMIQSSSMAFPVALVVPILVTGLILMCGFYARDECYFYNVIPSYLFFNSPRLLTMGEFVVGHFTWLWLLWLLSQIWITRHIWTNKNSKLASTEQLFMRPMYDAFLIEQSIAMNRRNVVDQLAKEDVLDEEDVTTVDEDKITRIYACATMWHETPEEMVEFFKSIFRMDEDQCAHRIVRQYLQYPVDSHYEWETHIFFDDAFMRKSKDDNDPMINIYVQDLIRTIPDAATEVHKTTVRISPPVIYPTPYGGRLVWTLPGKTKMIVHLKDKAKIRAKKRWSQVMYMYYLLGHRIMDNDDFDEQSVKLRSRNTYIMALDGDIDFQPDAVHLLVQCMRKKENLGAACGRIHPVGSGAMAWYQVFEYAVGHWMQKATEHVIGCVLCSPGCFSLFRASALMDHNVMARYTTTSSEARHYVQYDQGEDRWLCTLLLQRGWRVEYSAASDAYTHCPEGFNEFYNQRRRWMPSTTANIMDLLEDSDHIKKVNDDISTPYIFYQVVLMIGTIIGPGTIFLMLVGAFVTVFNMSQYDALWYNCIPVLTFSLICIISKSDTQLLAAAVISGFYGLVMMMVLIGVAMQIHEDGLLAPSSMFFFLMMGEYVVAALVHPKEIYCLKYGIIYLITVPSMYMLLVIYSVFNMNNVSWGTREVTVAPKLAEGEVKPPPKKKQSMVEEYLSKVKEFFMSCRGDSKHLTLISNSLISIQQKVDQIEDMVNDLDLENPSDDVKRKTTIIEGPRPSMRRSTIRKSTLQKPFGEDYDDLDEESLASSDGLQNNSWFYDEELIRGHVTFLDKKEETFWKDLLDRYLFPTEDDKEKVAKDLKDLRDKMAMSFFAINILFVVVVFLLTIKKEILHIDWPFNPTVNFTYSSSSNINEIVVMKTFLELEPIGFVFLIFFFSLMAVQFVAMMVHRFGTFAQIMANTDVNFGETKIEDMTEDEILQRDPIRTFRKLIKLKGVNGDDEKDEDVDEHVSRRKTVADLKKNKDKKRAVINNLDAAFQARMEKIVNGEDTDVAVPRKTIAAIQRRRTTVLHRKSQMPQFIQNAFKDFQNFPSDEGNSPLRHHFDNPAYKEDTDG